MLRPSKPGLPSPTDDELDRELQDLEEVPEPWLAVATGRKRPEEAFPDEPDLWPQLADADPAAADRIDARAVEMLLGAPGPAAAPTSVVPLSPPRRKWLAWAAPLAAAAALFLAFFPDRRSHDGVRQGEVRALPSIRSDAALHLTQGEHFYLECRVPGRTVEVVAIRATPAEAVDAPTRALGFTPEPHDPGVLHVHADLVSGSWDLTCGVLDAGEFAWIEPATRLRIDES